MKNKINPVFVLGLLLLAVMVFMPGSAHAASASAGGGLPYEPVLAKLVTSVSGPVAFGVATVALVACVGTLMFGGELAGFIKTMVFVILGGSTIVAGSSILQMFGGSSGSDTREGTKSPKVSIVRHVDEGSTSSLSL